jgi:LacI family transcriptional regulator
MRFIAYDLGRAAVDVLFDEIDRDHDETHRQATVHRVAMPVRTRESVAPPSA